MKMVVDDNEVYEYKFNNSKAYPFIIFNGNLYIGERYTVHNQLMPQIPGIQKTRQPIIKGRIWAGIKTDKFNYSLVSFWGGDTNEDLRPYVYELANKLKVNASKIVVVAKIGSFGDKDISMPVPLSQWNGTLHQLTSNEIYQKNLHMMDSGEKMKNTEGFRDIRGKKLGKKLTDSNGNEMPMAKYHSMIYQESRRPVTVTISESQYKRLFLSDKIEKAPQ
jgi:hypothetical protein